MQKKSTSAQLLNIQEDAQALHARIKEAIAMKLPGEKKHGGLLILVIVIIIVIIFLLWKRPELLSSLKSIVFKNP